MFDRYLPAPAIVEEHQRVSASVVTLRLRFLDSERQASYRFVPGQFNMLYLYGLGEVPISVSSDPRDDAFFEHTIRALGRITKGLTTLRPGDTLGVRGPFGRGWPVEEARGRDVVLIIEGLGCSPLVSVIQYLMRRRADYGRLYILRGVYSPDDLIWRHCYQQWVQQPGVSILLAAEQAGDDWPWYRGPVTDLLSRIDPDPDTCVAMLCGAELTMLAAVAQLREQGLADNRIWLSLQRNMQCGDGLCGQCQLGPHRVCRDGPVFRYAEIADFYGARGF